MRYTVKIIWSIPIDDIAAISCIVQICAWFLCNILAHFAFTIATAAMPMFNFKHINDGLREDARLCILYDASTSPNNSSCTIVIKLPKYVRFTVQDSHTHSHMYARLTHITMRPGPSRWAFTGIRCRAVYTRAVIEAGSRCTFLYVCK